MKKYNALIIGAGSIGGLKPEKFDNRKTKNILTVAHAFYKNKRIDLKGFVDSTKVEDVENLMNGSV